MKVQRKLSEVESSVFLVRLTAADTRHSATFSSHIHADCLVVYLVLLELPVDQQRRLFVHFLSDSVSHSIVGLQASVETCVAVLIVNILFGVSGESTDNIGTKSLS